MAAGAPARRPSLFQRIWQSRLAYLYILPAFLLMALITFYPIIYQLWMAFTNFELRHLRLQNPDWVWLDNFRRVLASELALPNYSFLRILVFNLVWTFVNIPLHVIIGVAVAWFIWRRLIAPRLQRSE